MNKILYLGNGNSIHIHKWLKYFSNDEKKFKIYLISDTKVKKQNIIFFKKNNIILHDYNFTGNYIINNIILFPLKFILINLFILFKKPNIIHIHFVSLNTLFILPIIFRKKIKKIASFWGSDYNINNPIRNLLKKIVSKYYDIITSDTNEILKGLEIKYNAKKKKLHYINHGVESNLFIFGKKNNFYENKFVIFSPRGLNSLYNHHILFENIKKLIEKFGTSILLIFIDYNSEEEYKNQLLNKIGKYPENIKIENTMNQKELLQMYNNSDIVISIPRRDGFPITIIESILSNKPIIGLDHKDYIKNLPKDFLINKKNLNINNLIKKIDLLKKYEIKNSLKKEFINKYDYERNMSKMLILYKK